MKLSEVAQKLGCRLERPSDDEISGRRRDRASRTRPAYLPRESPLFPLLKTTRASAVLVEEGISLARDPALAPLAALRSANPYLALPTPWSFSTSPALCSGDPSDRRHRQKSARIGENATSARTVSSTKALTSGRNAVLHSSVRFIVAPKSATISSLTPTRSCRESCRMAIASLANGVIIGGRLRLRQAKRRHLVQNAANGPAVLEDDVGSSGQLLRGSRDHRRDPRRPRGKARRPLLLVGHASRCRR